MLSVSSPSPHYHGYKAWGHVWGDNCGLLPRTTSNKLDRGEVKMRLFRADGGNEAWMKGKYHTHPSLQVVGLGIECPMQPQTTINMTTKNACQLGLRAKLLLNRRRREYGHQTTASTGTPCTLGTPIPLGSPLKLPGALSPHFSLSGSWSKRKPMSECPALGCSRTKKLSSWNTGKRAMERRNPFWATLRKTLYTSP